MLGLAASGRVSERENAISASAERTLSTKALYLAAYAAFWYAVRNSTRLAIRSSTLTERLTSSITWPVRTSAFIPCGSCAARRPHSNAVLLLSTWTPFSSIARISAACESGTRPCCQAKPSISGLV